MARLGIRWTIGAVSVQGFEALRLSVWGAYRLFGAAADYVICLNTMSLAKARALAGELPSVVAWRDCTEAMPELLRPHLDGAMAEGVGWKLAPLRMFVDRHELALDNDCILWEMPEAMGRWLAAGDGVCLIAADVRACFGKFADLCGPEPRNSGIRGLSPTFDLEAAFRDLLRLRPGMLTSELDEQGLQVAAVSRAAQPLVVSIEDVAVCSPFPPHLPHLGRCGAHFVGLNAHELPWRVDGRPGSDLIREHWRALRGELYARVGIDP